MPLLFFVYSLLLGALWGAICLVLAIGSRSFLIASVVWILGQIAIIVLLTKLDDARDKKRCSECAEPIQKAARKCKHCGAQQA